MIARLGLGPILGSVLLCLGGAGCCLVRSYETPHDVYCWQDPRPPQLSVHERAARYQQRLEARFQAPEGLLRYSWYAWERGSPSYGNRADGCFHTGIYLASQALRYAVTRDAAAREQVLKGLNGLRVLMEVTGKPGLLARHFSPAGTVRGDRRWLRSETHPHLDWRSDVSKDQYAGFIHGIGVTLAVVRDPEIRRQAAALARDAADHLIRNKLRIVDVDGEVTTFGDLRGKLWTVPIGVNALITLAIIKSAAVGTGESRFVEYYERLLRLDYARIAWWAHIGFFGIGNRVNDNMAYLALYPLLLLENDAAVASRLRAAAARSWSYLKDERNGFFAAVHAGAGTRPNEDSEREGARGRALQALAEFPDDKVVWPVDLTRGGFDFPRAWLNSTKCLPLSKVAIPLYLRPRGSNMWVSNPYRLAGVLGSRGTRETAGTDYLQAYWIARYHGLLEGP